MIVDYVDFASQAGQRRYDVCVAGSGPAGITLAMDAARRGLSVLVLEGGGRGIDFESQDTYVGELTGHDYFPLDICRLRYFGGTSNHWTGWCRPLDDAVFHKRSDREWSGWPITKEDLMPFEEEACRILGVQPWGEFEGQRVAGLDENLQEIRFQRAKTLLFAEVFGPELRDSQNITVVLHANLVNLVLGEDGRHVELAAAAHLFAPEKSVSVQARTFVLCLGGIENARFLLNCDKQVPAGIGNDNDLVGRFFMEHPTQWLGMAFLTKKGAAWFNSLASSREGIGYATLSPTPEFCASKGILNCNLRLDQGFLAADVVERGKQELKRYLCFNSGLRRMLEKHVAAIWCPTDIDAINVIRIGGSWEQAPIPASRITLTDARDRFGKRRIALDWQLDPGDRGTLRESAFELGRSLARNDFGRTRFDKWVFHDELPPPTYDSGAEVAGYHHMGTTRMADTPARGVVDADSKVFGLDNLYVGGSSVFPASGHSNPTFTIVQLALRLSKHLAETVS